MVNEDKKWFQVSLRLMGDGLSVDEIGSMLEIEPSFIGKKGDHINDNPRYARHYTNIWGWTFTRDSSISFEEQISELLDILEPKQQALSELLSLQEVAGELFLGFGSENGQGGAHFSALLLLRVANLGLDIDLDLYPKDSLGEDEWRTGSTIMS